MKKNNLWQLAIPAGIFVISFLMKIFFIGWRDISLDEPFTLFHAQQPIIDILLLPLQNEPNPPLFMLLMHFWIKLFGISPESVRILPLVFNSLTAVVLYLIGKRHFGQIQGLLASGLFLFSSYHFYFALEARTYSLMALATALSLYYFLCFLDDSATKKIRIGLIVSNLILIYSHYFGLLVIFVQVLLLALFFRENFLDKMKAYLIIFLGYAPMWYVLVMQLLVSAKGTWVQPPHVNDYHTMLGYFVNTNGKYMILAALFASLVVWFENTIKTINKKLIIIFLFWLIPYTIMFVISFKMPMFVNRYVLFNTIGFYAFIAVATTINYRHLKLSSGVAVVVVLSMVITMQINSKDFYYREVKNAVGFTKQNTDSSTIVIIYPNWAKREYAYYYEKQIFKNYKDFDAIMDNKKQYAIWSLNCVKDRIERNPGSKVILYEGGGTNQVIIEHLNSNFKLVDDKSFPQANRVRVYEPIKTQP
jgi:uncharacterized membrane protein